MSPELHQRVRKLFDEALDRPEVERLTFLQGACSDDPKVYEAVVRLLEVRTRAQPFLEEKPRGIERIGRYMVTGELGRGAMGIVYEAIDPLISRSVAIKIIHLSFLADATQADFMRDRLFREARAAGRLFHPGIVIILDVGQEGDIAFIAMERVDGPSLEKMLVSSQIMGLADSLAILRQTAAALDYAHQNGIVHRDVKPGNILLHKGTVVKVSDFGIAKSMSTEYGTMAGLMLGTPSYMSPEQIEQLPVDGRSDQFSLAVVAYELLSGSRPFQGQSLAPLAHTIVYGKRPSIRAINPALPAAVDEVLGRGLAKSPDDRYRSCVDFVDALEETLKDVRKAWREDRSNDKEPQPFKSISHQARRRRTLLVLTYSLLSVVAAVGIVVAIDWFWTAYVMPPAAVPNRPVVEFSINPDMTSAGDPATLQWHVAGATLVIIDHGIGNVGADGTFTVRPETPTIYTLRAISQGVSTSKQASVNVIEAPPDPLAHAHVLYDDAIRARQVGNYKDALVLFQRSAEEGDARSMQELGEMSMDGTGAAKNEKEAAKWFRKAAMSGYPPGMLYLGAMLLQGNGVEKNYKEAAYWFGRAADAGNASAMCDLGRMYEKGEGVGEDLEEATRLYKEGAKHGDDECAARLKKIR